MTSMPLLRRTRATLRSAEFGFFGVVVYTRTQTPRFCGLDWSAGAFVRDFWITRLRRMSWLIVGIVRRPGLKKGERLVPKKLVEAIFRSACFSGFWRLVSLT